MLASDYIDSAYRKNGIASPSTIQRTNGLGILNLMLSNWSADGLIVPYNTTEVLTLVVGAASYTIGTGGTFNTVRPLRIIDAFIRDSNSEDYPVDITMTKGEYNAITDKDADARPTRLYYDPQYPLGIIYFNYTPDMGETLYLVSEKSIIELASLDTEVNLPLFYKEPIVYNLAVRFAGELDNRLSQETIQIAVMGMNNLQNMVALDKLVKMSKMDKAMTWSVEQ